MKLYISQLPQLSQYKNSLRNSLKDPPRRFSPEKERDALSFSLSAPHVRDAMHLARNDITSCMGARALINQNYTRMRVIYRKRGGNCARFFASARGPLFYERCSIFRASGEEKKNERTNLRSHEGNDRSIAAARRGERATHFGVGIICVRRECN